MKKVGLWTVLKLCILLAACAPTISPATYRWSGSYDANENYRFRVTPESYTNASVSYTIPGQLPHPSENVSARLNCLSNAWTWPYGDDEAVFDYPHTNPDFQLSSNSLQVNAYSISCVNGIPRVQAPTFEEAIGMIAGRREKAIGSDRGRLVFRAYSGYIYPNIRQGNYWSDILVNIDSVSIKADHDGSITAPAGAMVAFRQTGALQSLFFDGEASEVNYDSTKDATIYVQRGTRNALFPQWDVVTFNYAEGWVTWQHTETPPTP